jgi:EmrB/QacA subfamily drug resistance transporter
MSFMDIPHSAFYQLQAYTFCMDKQQKLVICIAILASFVAFLDGSVVGVALPAISREFGGGLVIQQWVNDAYLITLGTLILAAGSLSDIFGRKRIITYGLYGFLVTSLLCAIAPSGNALIASRALQGVAGALLVPSSLAYIISTFSGAAQSKAIGTWTAWTGMAFIAGPLIGGLLVDGASWRWVFAINVVPIAAALTLLRLVKAPPEARRKQALDIQGIIFGAVGLGGIVYALIEQSRLGWTDLLIIGSLLVGFASLAYFVWHEHRSAEPMLPLGLFSVRNFWAGNLATFFIYAALALQGFLLVIFLQQVAGFTAVEAGLASLPVTIMMFFLSSRFGALSAKYGPQLFMTVGPFLCALGMLFMLRSSADVSYWTELFPGILLFGLGLSVTVSPLTSAILGSISAAQAGIGSAVNNAVARIAGLIAVAAIGTVIGSSVSLEGFHQGLMLCMALLLFGGFVSYVGIQNHAGKSVSA